MRTPTSERAAWFSPLRLLARTTASISKAVATALAFFVTLLVVPVVGNMTDWMVGHQKITTNGVRTFLWKDADYDTPPPSCVAAACGMATVPLQRSRQVGSADSTIVTTHVLWPAPEVIEASPGTYLEVVGAIDALHPVVQRSDDALALNDPLSTTRPLLLANEVHHDGHRRPIMVSSEGFVSGWTLQDNGEKQLTAWMRPGESDRNGHSQEAAIERSRQWRDMKMRKVQFQPVPPVVEVDVLRAALMQPIQVGYVLAFDWQSDGVLAVRGSQLVPSRSVVGLVTRVREIGQYQRIQVEIPRTSPYGRGHWLWHRLDEVPLGQPTLPHNVRALFFKPSEMLGATPDWMLLEREVSRLPEVEVMYTSAAALDPTCAEPAVPSHACVWIMLQGVAVPIQVRVQNLPGGVRSLTERSVFAGKALRPADWAALPRKFRSLYGSPSVPGPKLSRILLTATVNTLLVPQPWLKAGMPVSVAEKSKGEAP